MRSVAAIGEAVAGFQDEMIVADPEFEAAAVKVVVA
jgi:hypothetical protein